MTYAIVAVSLLLSACSVVLAVLSIRFNMRAEQTWRRVSSMELERHGR